jgi:hypothetical protein
MTTSVVTPHSTHTAPTKDELLPSVVGDLRRLPRGLREALQGRQVHRHRHHRPPPRPPRPALPPPPFPLPSGTTVRPTTPPPPCGFTVGKGYLVSIFTTVKMGTAGVRRSLMIV